VEVSVSNPSEFEVTKRICKLVLKHAGEALVYKSWSDEFAIQEMRSVVDKVNTTIDVTGFSLAQCEELGFGKWEEGSNLRLIPLWLFPFLSDQVEYTAIDGDKIKGRDQMDNDHRFGCLAFGIVPAE
jgi:hypothetical protein